MYRACKFRKMENCTFVYFSKKFHRLRPPPIIYFLRCLPILLKICKAFLHIVQCITFDCLKNYHQRLPDNNENNFSFLKFFNTYKNKRLTSKTNQACYFIFSVSTTNLSGASQPSKKNYSNCIFCVIRRI